MPASSTPGLGAWLLGYGAFLVAAGLAGFLSNPEKAATALVSGGTFGALSMAWGLLLRSGRRWALQAALATTGLLTLVFAWRATASWLAFLGGQPGKLVAAALITAMLVASVVTLARLARGDGSTRPARAGDRPGDRARPEAPR
jgi:uncharacterized membrane protein (UPF0136 family)